MSRIVMEGISTSYRALMSPKVLHVSTYDANSGAGRAAHGLHTALRQLDVDSRMLVASSDTHDPAVTSLANQVELRWRLAQRADRLIWELQQSPNTTWRSPAFFGALSAAAINRSSADIVNLHWVTNGFISIKEIGRIRKPIVWSMYDMWSFTGTEHYGVDVEHARWLEGYSTRNRAPGESGIDIDLQAWRRKQKHFNQPMTLVPSSAWLEDRVSRSKLAQDKGWTVARIPHVVDTQTFAPMNRSAARSQFGLPNDSPIVLFLASGGVQDKRKGWDLLDAALGTLRDDFGVQAHVAIAGSVLSDFSMRSRTPAHILGSVNGNEQLRTLYAAADVVAVPSRDDTMPLTAMEAQACGIPVAAFNIGGLPDIIEHQSTGYLAIPFDQADLARGLYSLMTRNDSSFSDKARDRAVSLWSSAVVARQYLDLYQGVLSARA